MTAPATPDGLLLVDKPAGRSSHDVVSAARRALGEKRIGHAGTLDPFATGLLVLLVGRATRLIPHLPDEPKVYDATVAFGAETDTEDLHGAVVREAPRPTREALLAHLRDVHGPQLQVPPAYSAKRVDGQRAYALARAGREVTLKPAPITVFRVEVLGMTDDDAGRVAEATVRVTVSGGTYVRSLARDWAREAGSAAHLTGLRRLRTGAFDVADALPFEALQAGQVSLQPALAALPGVPVQRLSDDELARLVRGIDVPATVPGPWGALVRGDRDVLVALCERRAGDASTGGDRWQPRVVMREA